MTDVEKMDEGYKGKTYNYNQRYGWRFLMEQENEKYNRSI